MSSVTGHYSCGWLLWGKTSVLIPAEAPHSSQVQTSKVLWSSAWCIPWVVKTLEGHTKRACQVKGHGLERIAGSVKKIASSWWYLNAQQEETPLNLSKTSSNRYYHTINFSTSTPNFIYTQHSTMFLFSLTIKYCHHWCKRGWVSFGLRSRKNSTLKARIFIFSK